ncbi:MULTISPECIES: RNA polymerase sigma factor [Niastella]|uniref:Sigma-70 family RNA polymerase sigma factor n=1 Tax=Niastella soli TaxID=2821487 RepID=A0ABS3Z145_9BACT|nr:sigma-70 family RNA polymerase sigma factor [Niastella soli]MBO9203884.1 sigma-70 family RNA polymerase sigma factor [Niastella soli]
MRLLSSPILVVNAIADILNQSAMLKKSFQPSVLHEEDLIKLIRQNDSLAFDLLYKKYWNRLLHFAFRYVKDGYVCQEIVQELFVQLHTSGARLKINSSLSSYLFVAIRNRIYNYLRNRALYKKHITLAGKRIMSSHNNVEQAINFMDVQKKINDTLCEMPEKYRVVYLLHDKNNFTVKKISEALNRPVNTVEKQLRKAMYMLRDRLVMHEMTV